MEAFQAPLHFLAQVLTEIGGGGGQDWHNMYVRHLLPMLMWSVIFAVGWRVEGRHQSTKRGRILLMGIVSIFLFEAWHFFAVYFTHPTPVLHPGGVAGPLSNWLFGPISAALLIVIHGVLATGTMRFLPTAGAKPHTLRFLLVSSLAVIATFVTSVYLWQSTAEGSTHSFHKSAGYGLLLLLHIVVLANVVLFLWRIRSHSYTNQYAWAPFTMFLCASIVLLFNVTSAHRYAHTLQPIAHNLLIWATPWFGYLYWRFVSEEQEVFAQRVYQAERMDVVGRLAAGVAHDFNNHLQAMMGYAEVGRDSAEKFSESAAAYDNIIESIERASVLVKQLMAFRQEDSVGKVEVINLAHVVVELAPMLNGLMGAKIEAYNDLDPNTDYLVADRSKLEQAIVNVVVNARDAMPEGGTLTMRSRRIPVSEKIYSIPMMRLTVQDTGKGMSTAAQARVFEPFYTTKLGSGGSGLGLATSYVAIQAMGGRMAINSIAGEGTTLAIDLPAADAPEKQIEQTEEKELDLSLHAGTERILVAEDEPALRHIAAIQLKRGGYSVGLARDGEHTLEQLAASVDDPYDLLLLDVMMPRMDGYTAYQEVHKLYPTLPVIFVSAHADPHNVHIPNAPHMTKPYQQRALMKLVRETLDAAAAK